MSKARFFVASVLAATGVLASTVALANRGADVQWSVTVGAPIGVPVYTHASPVHAHPSRVYVQPAPVFTQPHPSHRGGSSYHWRDHHHQHYQQPTRWDHDGDGIPNRQDRLYNPRWDVDGDGIPNRHDRHDSRYRGR